MAKAKNLPVKVEPDSLIIRVRGQSVILDSDLATLYCVPTKRLNEQVKRNKERFPDDFVFQLSEEEARRLRSQSVTTLTAGKRSQNATASRRNIRHQPYAFTEHGAVMAANVLKSTQAIQMSVAIVRAFVRLRRMARSVEGLARKVDALESKYDKQFKTVFDAIRQLILQPEPTTKKIGFHEK